MAVLLKPVFVKTTKPIMLSQKVFIIEVKKQTNKHVTENYILQCSRIYSAYVLHCVVISSNTTVRIAVFGVDNHSLYKPKTVSQKGLENKLLGA